MPGSVNKVILVGCLGKEPDCRRTSTGKPVINLSLATSESWKDKATGERKERTEWHRVVIFNPGLAGIAEKYAHKGTKVYLEGQLSTRKYTDKDGIEKYTTEVVLNPYHGEFVLLGPNQNGGAGGGGFGGGTGAGAGGAGGFGGAGGGAFGGGTNANFDRGGLDDDIPF